jgi:hypothetical protein
LPFAEATRLPDAVRDDDFEVDFTDAFEVVPFFATVLRVLALAGPAAKAQIKAKIKK